MAIVTVTAELIEMGKSERGGWNARQLRCIKVKWPLEKRWKEKAIGTQVRLESAAMFLELRRGGMVQNMDAAL